MGDPVQRVEHVKDTSDLLLGHRQFHAARGVLCQARRPARRPPQSSKVDLLEGFIKKISTASTRTRSEGEDA